MLHKLILLYSREEVVCGTTEDEIPEIAGQNTPH